MNKNIKIITSINNPYIKELMHLKEKKYRIINKSFLVEGKHLVEEAYKENRLKEIIFINDKDILAFPNVQAIKVNADIIKKLSDTINPQEIMGVCEIKDIDVDYNKYKRILVLDTISDPGNMGTLIRSAIGFNIDLIVCSNDSCDIYNSKVVRSTQGAIFKIPIIYCDLTSEIDKMKKHNFMVISTSLDATMTINEINNCNNNNNSNCNNNCYAIILGNEAAGVKKEIQTLADVNVIIPINKKLESLNVSVAGSIMMYELDKKGNI